ncbi:MAG: hypothetical protein HY583_03000 [Candidatus Omnitrophica bacterium]|nr:hypothetical protein [Candidatus Omnitrophota bacterium]
MKKSIAILFFVLSFQDVGFCIDFDFSSSPVRSDDWSGGNYIEEASWHGNQLWINVVTTRNCGSGITGGVRQNGERLEIFLNQEYSGGPIPECLGKYGFIFKIKTIEKKDYEIIFKNGYTDDILQLRTDNSASDRCDDSPDFNCYRNVLFPRKRNPNVENAKSRHDDHVRNSNNPISQRLNVDFISMAPNQSSMTFIYNGEEIDYGISGIEFKDRPMWSWFFRFKETLPPPADVSKEELMECIQLADTAYKLMEKSGRFDPSSLAFVKIDRGSKTAQFEAGVIPDDNDKKLFMLIHNRQIRLMTPIQKKVKIDLIHDQISFIKD